MTLFKSLTKLLIKLNRARELFRLKPFDTATEVGRSNERYRLILLSSTSSMLAKVFSVATTLISVPLTLHYLGTERFGLWMTISSVIAMLSFADLGIGNGLLNVIADANGKDDSFTIRRYISSAFALLGSIALLFLLVFYIIYPFVPWADFFNVKSQLAIREAGSALVVLVLCFALNLPIGVVQRAQMGMQKSFIANLWQIVASLLSLAILLIAIHLKMGLPWLVAAIAGIPLIISMVNGIVFFAMTNNAISPKFSLISLAAIKKIAHSGTFFFLLQIASLIAFQSDILIISHYLGPDSVAAYSIVMKIFSIPPLVLSFYLMALWPAYGEAMSRNDVEWVKRIYKKSLIISFKINVPLTILLMISSKMLITLWVGPAMSPSWDVIVGMGLWSILTVLGGNYAALLNGLHMMRFQAFLASLMAIVNIFLSIWLVKMFGISGAIFGSVASLLFVNYIPLHIFITKFLKRTN